MGTNYYAKSKLDVFNNDSGYHIGKSSYGWEFSFRGYKEEDLTSWVKWKSYLKAKKIVDEYGKTISFKDFVKMIETTKAPNFKREDGHINLNHNNECKKNNDFNDEYDWNDEMGYSFGAREFS